MSAWFAATFALLLGLAAPLVMAGWGPLGRRLAAVQLLNAIGLLLLVAMTFAFHIAAAMNLALTLAVLTLPAALLFAVFVERWL